MLKEEIARNVGPSGIDIVYERLGSPDAPPVLLIMGGGAQMIAWPDGFCDELVRHGLQVIRFDNRDTGLSTHMANAHVPDWLAAMRGDFSTVSYTLSDMAADTVGLMDHLGFDRVHAVGASMGGMIAQTLAIEYPERILSLTSIMSTTGDPLVGKTDYAFLAGLGAPPVDGEGAIEWQVNSLRVVGSTKYPFDEAEARDRATRSWGRDHDPLGMLRQSVAVLKSGDRTEKLRAISAPTLVIHGDADRMFDQSGGEATASAIPGAELVIYEGMGHGLPRPLWADIADRINALLSREANEVKLFPSL